MSKTVEELQDEINELKQQLEQTHEDYRVHMLQYENLRKHFTNLHKEILGKDYYNMAMDVYECDKAICEDLAEQLKIKNKVKRSIKEWVNKNL